MRYNMNMIFISADLIGMAISVIQNTDDVSEDYSLIFIVKKISVVFTAKDYLIKDLCVG